MSTSSPAAEVIDLHKSYRRNGGSEPFRAVAGISFQVPRGQILGLLGPNGAGKTTTIKSLCGLIRPDQGELRVNGIDVSRQRSRALRQLANIPAADWWLLGLNGAVWLALGLGTFRLLERRALNRGLLGKY